jgi:quercetin dioxygenase-like cupin family protein
MNNMYEQKILNLFKDFYFLPNSLIMVGRLPDPIIEEIDKFTVLCADIKNHPLSFLKNHVNVGMNKYQVSVPTNVFEDSFTFAFIVHMGSYYLSQHTKESLSQIERSVTVRKNHGHFDAYDFWVNFIESGDFNDWHTHGGSLSGVIYVDNKINLETKFKNNISFCGKKGDIIMFPSNTEHMVEKNATDETRITYAYNLDIAR